MGLDDLRDGRVVEEDGRSQRIDAHALDESLQDVGIEASGIIGKERLHSRVAYHGIPIRLLAHHGLEGVRDRYDAGEDVYLPARRFSWIALRVPALVVLEADEADVVGIHE